VIMLQDIATTLIDWLNANSGIMSTIVTPIVVAVIMGRGSRKLKEAIAAKDATIDSLNATVLHLTSVLDSTKSILAETKASYAEAERKAVLASHDLPLLAVPDARRCVALMNVNARNAEQNCNVYFRNIEQYFWMPS